MTGGVQDGPTHSCPAPHAGGRRGRDRENALVTPTPAVLALEDGTVFRGISIGAPGVTTGEVVFNTAMTGYQEILTDPSYARQIVTLTYPHIGNTGVTPEDLESDSVHAAGLVIRDLPLLAFQLAREPFAVAVPGRRRNRRDRGHRHAQAHPDPARARRPGRLHRDGGPRRRRRCAARGARLSGPQGHGPRQGRVGARALPVERGQHRPRGEPRAAAGLAPARRRLRLRHQAQHPAPARRLRLPHDRRAGADQRRGCAGARSRRHLPVERPRRPGALRLRDRARSRNSSKPTSRSSASASATSCSGSRAARAR